MKKLLLMILVLFLISCKSSNHAITSLDASMYQGSVIVIGTTSGDISIKLDKEKSPETVVNFLAYVDKGYYDGTIFHRVIKNKFIQGGGFKDNLITQPTLPPIKNEAGNGLKNQRGTIAMARTGVVGSATSQFFINTVDNAFLDHRDNSTAGFGYAVFGQVVDGMNVVDKIGNAPTDMRNRFSDVPVETVTIKSVKRATKKP